MSRLTNAHDIELESTFQQLALDLGGDAVETDVAAREDRRGIGGRRIGCGCHFEKGRLKMITREGLRANEGWYIYQSTGVPRGGEMAG